MREGVPDMTIRLRGAQASSETTLSTVRRTVVVLVTDLADERVTLSSVYVGEDDAAGAVVHLLLGPDRRMVREVLELDRREVPVTRARDRCLLDHAVRLQHVLEQHSGEPVEIDVGDAALAFVAAR